MDLLRTPGNYGTNGRRTRAKLRLSSMADQARRLRNHPQRFRVAVWQRQPLPLPADRGAKMYLASFAVNAEWPNPSVVVGQPQRRQR